ncbi:MAG: ethanolamine permease [Candidatus Sericytochromatia bacterium]|nr:ethanolamine permease [Candidatus Sericytochromatia bacterium]
MSTPEAPAALKRVLTPIHLWAIAVGLVISGDYFGWNYGLAQGGPVGMMIATGMVTVMYVCFIFSYTELSTAIPSAGGPFAYAKRAMGPFVGFLAGFATLLEFVFAPPAIALAIGSYLNFRVPALPIIGVAIGAFVVFVGLNVAGVGIAALFELVVTAFAVLELGIFFATTAPHIQVANIITDPLLPFGWWGVFAAIPFGIWFYLAIEGVAMSAEEVINPRRDIPRGYIAGILTLVVLATGTLICTTGVVPWQELVKDDSPLPKALATVLSKDHWLTHMMVYLGLFGLLASFHGIIMGYSRQVFALARSGYLPAFFARLHPTRRTPVAAIVAPAIVGSLAVLTGKTGEIITIAVMGAIIMYIISMIALFQLRRREPDLDRPYRAPCYPAFPAIALFLALVCLAAVVINNPGIAVITVVAFGLGTIYYKQIAAPRVAALDLADAEKLREGALAHH